MGKNIKVQVLSVAGFGKALVKVIGQTDRNGDFTPNGSTFRASNGVTLVSSVKPARDANRKANPLKFYLRGSDVTKDSTCFDVTTKDLPKLVAAIEEYNRTYKYYVKPVYAAPAPRRAPAAAADGCSFIVG